MKKLTNMPKTVGSTRIRQSVKVQKIYDDFVSRYEAYRLLRSRMALVDPRARPKRGIDAKGMLWKAMKYLKDTAND